MSDFTSVNAGAMQQGIADLNTAYKGLTEHLSTLEGQLNASLGQWDGAARAAYADAKAKWDAAANHMGDVIAKMQQVMTQISENYDSNERGIEGKWGA